MIISTVLHFSLPTQNAAAAAAAAAAQRLPQRRKLRAAGDRSFRIWKEGLVYVVKSKSPAAAVGLRCGDRLEQVQRSAQGWLQDCQDSAALINMWQLPSTTDLDLVFLAGHEEDRELASALRIQGCWRGHALRAHFSSTSPHLAVAQLQLLRTQRELLDVKARHPDISSLVGSLREKLAGKERRIDQLSASAKGHAWALRVLTQRLEAAERRGRDKAMVQSDLSLRQLGALRRLDGLPDAVDSGDNGVVNGANAAAAAVGPVMCEVACATDMEVDAVDAVDEVEALKSELEALKQQQKQHPKEYADKGVPCSDDESDPVPQEVPQEVPALALLDKDDFEELDEATTRRLQEISQSMAAMTRAEDTTDIVGQGGSLFITLLARSGKLGFRLTAAPGLLVYRTERCSWAEAAGLQRGDQLVKVSGVDAKLLTWQQLQRALRLRPLELTFFRGPGTGPSHLLEQIAETLSGFRAWNLTKDDVPQFVASPLEVPVPRVLSPDRPDPGPDLPDPTPRPRPRPQLELLEDPLEVLAAVAQDPSALRCASERLRSSKDFLLEVLRGTPSEQVDSNRAKAFHFASDELKKDRQVVKAAVQLDAPEIFPSVAARFQADREIVELAVKQHGNLLSFASEELRHDKALALLAVESDGWAVQFLAPELCRDQQVVMAALQQTLGGRTPGVFPFLVGTWRDHLTDVVAGAGTVPLMRLLQGGAECVKDDRELAMAALQQNCDIFPFLSFNLKAEKDLVLQVVKEKGGLLKHASPLLQADKEVVLAAVQQNGCALLHASPLLRRDTEVVLHAVRQNHEIFPLLAERIIALAAVQGDGMLLSTVPKSLQCDTEVAMAAVQQNPAALEHVDVTLRPDTRQQGDCADITAAVGCASGQPEPGISAL
eukprot:s3347_g7.t2